MGSTLFVHADNTAAELKDLNILTQYPRHEKLSSSKATKQFANLQVHLGEGNFDQTLVEAEQIAYSDDFSVNKSDINHPISQPEESCCKPMFCSVLG